jgi:acetate kinase
MRGAGLNPEKTYREVHMPEVIGVLNAGSSSIKFSLFNLSNDQAELLVHGQAEGIYTAPRFVAKNREGKVMSEKSWPEGTKLGHDGAIDYLFSYVRAEFTDYNLLGVGHRVVCGGLDYTHPARVNPEVLSKLERLIPLFPLHQPHNLEPIRLLLERRPELPQVACFDTSFHRTNPRIAQLYALPPGIRRGRGSALWVSRPFV